MGIDCETSVLLAAGNSTSTALSASQLSHYDDFRQGMQQRLTGLANLARTDRNWSPRADLVFQPNDAQSCYASWSRSFQP